MPKKKTTKKSSPKDLSITPLADRVVIEPLHEEVDDSPAGIYLPESATSKEKPERGVVVAVGPGKTTDEGNIIPPMVAVGDTVIFSKYSPDEIVIDEVTYLVIKEDSILGIIG